jgi:pilus assembly protein CpaD
VRDEDETMINRVPNHRRRTLSLLGALSGLTVALGGCNTVQNDVVASVPEDYRLRHPIAIEEANQSIVVFVGHGRGGLSASQRADIIGLARAWRREATGAIVADVPVHGITVHHYRPDDPRLLAAIRLDYPKIAAVAGPCGLWPEDLGPSIDNPSYSQNRSYYNFGCAYQRNLAAMVDNPADLVQPRPETPAYTERRTEGFDKYRKGNATATNYPESEKAKLSDAGK